MMQMIENMDDGMKRMAIFFEDHDNDPALLKLQVNALRNALLRVFQELETMRTLLAEKQIVSKQEFRKNMKDSMLGDHWGGGGDPWCNHTYYPYILSEDDYLTEILGLDKDGLAAFRDKAEAGSRLT